VRANASAFAEYLERALEIAHRALYPATVATDGANSASRWRKLKRIMRGRTSSMALAPEEMGGAGLVYRRVGRPPARRLGRELPMAQAAQLVSEGSSMKPYVCSCQKKPLCAKSSMLIPHGGNA
jgi:hypothetical protein